MSKPGIGAAIDSAVLCIAFMQMRGLNRIGIICNHLAVAKFAETQALLVKRFLEILPKTPLRGVIGDNPLLNIWVENGSIAEIAQWFTRLVALDEIILE